MNAHGVWIAETVERHISSKQVKQGCSSHAYRVKREPKKGSTEGVDVAPMSGLRHHLEVAAPVQMEGFVFVAELQIAVHIKRANVKIIE